MIIHRSNGNANPPVSTAEERFASMQRHHEQVKRNLLSSAAPPAPPSAPAAPPPPPVPPGGGDLVYGARAIAGYLFGQADDRARRRVFHLWTHYRDRMEDAGFRKLNGALCLSKSKWRGFHGL